MRKPNDKGAVKMNVKKLFFTAAILLSLLLVFSGCAEENTNNEKYENPDNNYPNNTENQGNDSGDSAENTFNELPICTPVTCGQDENQGQINEEEYLENREADSENEGRQKNVCIYFFSNNSGEPCLREKSFLEKLSSENSNVEIHEFIITKQDDRQLFYELGNALNYSTYSVPVTIIGSQVIKGFGTSETTGQQIKEIVENCENCGCPEI
jgi:hypothetical protein